MHWTTCCHEHIRLPWWEICTWRNWFGLNIDLDWDISSPPCIVQNNMPLWYEERCFVQFVLCKHRSWILGLCVQYALRSNHGCFEKSGFRSIRSVVYSRRRDCFWVRKVRSMFSGSIVLSQDREEARIQVPEQDHPEDHDCLRPCRTTSKNIPIDISWEVHKELSSLTMIPRSCRNSRFPV